MASASACLNLPPESDIMKVACVGYFLTRTIEFSYFDTSRGAKSEHAEYLSPV